MSNTQPELSSLATGLDDIVARITEIISRPAGEVNQETTIELVEVERQLQRAQRRLNKLISVRTS